ncbi:integral membrane protein [Aspergillus sclerotialis]|uniref:Integral membrane protein n=1 Tax=Aspergillus sclerotialis TaxID=2070753 RepID=A0A3A2ZA02_9EURO|nr:integral membrane protein [Aspergillus sclerotialis]
MDRIEPADGSNGPPDRQQGLGSELNPLGSTSYPRNRNRTLSRSRRPSIRIQRPPSSISIGSNNHDPEQDTRNHAGDRRSTATTQALLEGDEWQGRRRSSSEPRPGRWSSPPTNVMSRVATRDYQIPMLTLKEESSNQSPIATSPSRGYDDQLLTPPQQPPPAAPPGEQRSLLRRTSEAALNRFSRNRASTVSGGEPSQTNQSNRLSEYDSRVVDVLDVIDPEVSALSTLTNVQNSLFIPHLGTFVNRQPTYTISPPEAESLEETTTTEEGEELSPVSKDDSMRRAATLDRLHSVSTLSSVLEDPRFAVLPEGSNLEGWTKADAAELNDHVRHMLHSRRSKFKRAMKGFGKYVSKPVGFLVTLYATLITLFGLAWVLFLIGWINVGGQQLYVINVIDNVLVALFAIMGDGLAPFRAIDTYHMIFIAYYGHLTWKIREKRALPRLKNKNDFPARREVDVDVEFGDTPKDEEFEFSVLNRLQQLRLIHHQTKFARSHTFYKPHETFTHYAFPLKLLIAIVVILDFHSIFQIALGACTWGINYHVRPFALTTVILCLSITCNITGGVLIMIGDRLTRKKDVVERLFRQQLTQEAIKKMEKKKKKKAEKRNAHMSVVSENQPYEGT